MKPFCEMAILPPAQELFHAYLFSSVKVLALLLRFYPVISGFSCRSVLLTVSSLACNSLFPCDERTSFSLNVTCVLLDYVVVLILAL